MPFPPQQDHRISVSDARAMTRRFREAAPQESVRGCMFPRAAFEAILSQAGCEGIRLYFGQGTGQGLQLIMVGVDGDALDMSQGEILENSFPCPPFCDPRAVLTS